MSTGHPVASALMVTSLPVPVPVGGITSHATSDETTFEIYVYGREWGVIHVSSAGPRATSAIDRSSGREKRRLDPLMETWLFPPWSISCRIHFR